MRPRPRAFLPGLVLALLIGGIVGGGVSVLVAPAVVGAAWGAVAAAGVGFVLAWLWRGRAPEPEPDLVEDPSPAWPSVDEPRVAAETFEAAPVRQAQRPFDLDELPLPAPEVAQPEPDEAQSAAPVTVAELVESTSVATEPAPLVAASVRLDGVARTRSEALDEIGALLVAAGAVDSEFVESMQVRELGVSSYMGNTLAVPRGSSQFVRTSALALVRYVRPIDWRGNQVRFVVAIAGTDEAAQVRLMSQVAEVFLDDVAVAALERAEQIEDVLAAFAG